MNPPLFSHKTLNPPFRGVMQTTPTPVIPHPILTYNRQRRNGCADGIAITRFRASTRARSPLQDDNTEKTRDAIKTIL